jgi:YD repeat-containing protein
MSKIRRFAAWTAILALAMFLSVTAVVEPVFATDSDSDGLSSELEAALGTSDSDADYDDDNIGDHEEVFVLGTDPTLPDSDCDSIDDSFDPEPLDGGDSQGGETTPSLAYDSNLAHAAVVGTTPFEGRGVSMSGELETVLFRADFGPGLMGQNVLELRYLSGITCNGPWGRNVVANWDDWVEVLEGGNVAVYKDGRRYFFDEDSGTYTAPAGFPYALTLDTQAGEYVLTAIRGGKAWRFDEGTGLLSSIEDRFSNTLTVNRDQYGAITSFDLPEGNSVTVTAYASGRYSGLADWSQTARTWTLEFNCKDELARATGPLMGETVQYFYINGSDDEDLNADLVRMLLPQGQTAMAMEYDEYDRVTKQTLGADVATFSYTSTATTVTDPAGNQRVWNHTAGEVVPTSLVVYSNRDVRQGDPASWTTTFAHNSNLLCTKIVHPEGNRTDFDWTGYCLTERREKATNTDTDDNDEDLVSTFSYGSTYHELEDSTDPEGNVTERTLNGLEQVLGIEYETITHTDPDVAITESFTWNADGTLATHTDGEGAVTRFDYYTSGAKTGLVWKVTRDYGTGTLNLVTEYDYSEYRYLQMETDPDGNTWVYGTDPLGRRLTSSAPSGTGQTTWTWNENGWLTQKDVANVDKTNSVDQSNPWWTTTFEHDVRGRVSTVFEEITANTTRVTNRQFDGNGNVTQITLPELNIVRQVWDERGLLAERTRGFATAAASTEYFAYDGNRNLTTYTNGRSKTSTLSYDDFGRKVGEETPLGHYASFTLDKCGHVTETRRYDALEVLLAASKQVHDEVGRVWANDEWLDGDADATVDAGEWIRTEYAHDDCGRVLVVTDPLSNDTLFTFDAVGRKLAQEDALGNETQWDYTDDYRVPCEISEIEQVPGGGTETFVTEIVTDALHRVVERRVVDRLNSANKHVFKTKYTSLSVAVEEEDALGNKTYAWHDGLGRVTHTQRDLGNSEAIDTYFGFDDNGNQITLTDDSSHTTTWNYNSRDLVTSITYHDSASRGFTWNGDDTLLGWTDENGTEVTNTYDDDGRLTGRAIDRAVGVLGPTAEAYTYDGLGRLTQGTNDNSTVQRAYDTFSRLLSETQGPNPLGQSGKTISYTYDDGGNRVTCEYFSGYDLVYTPDAVGRWTKIEDAQSNDLVTWQFYGPGGRTKRAVHLNGTSENLVYDGFQFVTDVDHKDSVDATFAGFDCGYDAMGNPLYEERTHQNGAGDCYAYDKAYRLTAALIGSSDPSAECADSDWDDYSHVKLIEYDLDDVSNRTSVDTTPYQGQTSQEGYTTNSVNAYTQVGVISRTHDTNGNLTSAGSTSMAYDYRNNLIKVTQGPITLVEFEYDVFNRRTRSSAGATVKHYRFDGLDPVESFDGSGNTLGTYVIADVPLDAMMGAPPNPLGQQGGVPCVYIAEDRADVDGDQITSEVLTFAIHTDAWGSVDFITAPDGAVVEKYTYSPFGETTILDGDDNDLDGVSAIGIETMFRALQRDEVTGLYVASHGAYDPHVACTLQVRPTMGFGLAVGTADRTNQRAGALFFDAGPRMGVPIGDVFRSGAEAHFSTTNSWPYSWRLEVQDGRYTGPSNPKEVKYSEKLIEEQGPFTRSWDVELTQGLEWGSMWMMVGTGASTRKGTGTDRPISNEAGNVASDNAIANAILNTLIGQAPYVVTVTQTYYVRTYRCQKDHYVNKKLVAVEEWLEDREEVTNTTYQTVLDPAFLYACEEKGNLNQTQVDILYRHVMDWASRFNQDQGRAAQAVKNNKGERASTPAKSRSACHATTAGEK